MAPAAAIEAKTILLVEDEAVIAMTEAMVLEKNGYSVLTVRTGEQAIRTFRENKGIDLVLMDIDLGRGMDGTRAAEIMLAEKDVPVVFLSSHTEPEVVDKTERITSYGYVVKDSGDTVLLASIRMAFRLHSAHRELRNREERLIETLEQRRAAEDALQKSEEKYRALVEATNTGMVILDDEGRVIDANREYLRITGRENLEDIVGRPVTEWTAPYDLERNAVEVKRCITEGYVRNLIIEYVDAKGAVTPVEINAAMVRMGERPHIVSLCRDITERRKAESELAEARTFLKSAFEQMPVPMMLLRTSDNTIYIGNSAFREMLGIADRPSYAGWNIMELERTWQDLNPDGSPIQYDDFPIIQAIRGNSVRNKEYLIRRADGSERWALAHAGPVYSDAGRLIVAFIALPDITEQMRLRNELRDSEEKYRFLMEKTSDIIWTLDMNMRTTYVSPSIGRVLGFTPEERMTQDPVDQMTPASFAHAAETLAAELARENEPGVDPGRSIMIETEYYHRDGSIVYLENNVTWQRDENSSITGIHGVSRDITARRAALTDLAAALEEKESLLAELQHRVKNSLGIIMNLVGFEAEKISDPAMKGVLAGIRNRIISLAQLYDTLSRSNEIREIQLDQYLRNVGESILGTDGAGRGRIALSMDLEEMRIGTRQAVPLGLILNELLTNAMKYAFPGGRSGSIRIGLARKGDAVLLSVADDGVGLPPGFSMEKSGGLGLLLVRRLAAQLDGTVEHVAGPGTGFCVTFATKLKRVEKSTGEVLPS